MRRIRWVGHPSPFEDPVIQKDLEAARIPMPLVQALRRFEHNRRISVLPGKSTFSVGFKDGMSRSYVWGPTNFEIEMEDKDWDILRRHPLDASMFLDITDFSPLHRPPLTKRQWMALIDQAERTPKPKVMLAV